MAGKWTMVRNEASGTGRRRAVGLWLLLLAAAVVVQTALGGVTRLTDSGLSITEWKPLLGVIPPLDEAGWREAFAKYQRLPQYVQLKSHMTLEEFKVIYFWEWFHRLWGRLLGVFFLVPFVVFYRRGAVSGLGGPLLALFVLGGLQGALGWFMVQSGLQDLVYVSHLRLAAHFLLAMVLLGALLWLGLELAYPRPTAAGAAGLRAATLVLFGLVVVQLAWGALTAGLKAGAFAPTWPTMNGLWVPPAVFEESWVNHPVAVQFVHRTLGLVVLAACGAWWWASRHVLGLERHLVLALAVAQVALGIATVLNATDRDALLVLGVAHQVGGTLLFGAVVAALRALKPSGHRLARLVRGPAAVTIPARGGGPARRARARSR